LSAVEETKATGTGHLLSDHCWYLKEVRNLTIKADDVLAEAADCLRLLLLVPMRQYCYYICSVVLLK
jgi:hypothetical protein